MPVPDGQRHQLRVLTINCWNIEAPYEQRMRLLNRVIAACSPDLVGFQEIVVRRNGFDQAATILADLGYRHAFGAAHRWTDTELFLPHDADGDGAGNLVASRWPLERFEVRALPGLPEGEQQSACGAVVTTPAGRIAFVSTHLYWDLAGGVIRERQVVALDDFVRTLAADTDLPPVLVGDLNADPDATEMRFLRGLASLDGRSTHFQDAWLVGGDGGPGFTWDNRNPYTLVDHEPDRRIDYILVGRPDAAGRGGIVRAALVATEPTGGVFPTDHFGVVADIRV
jgi:endonuclease/exonuclease/phosphatase family metal-dependent hydrolase